MTPTIAQETELDVCTDIGMTPRMGIGFVKE